MRKVRAPGPSSPVRFLRDEDGSMIVFSLFLILVGLIVAGMSIDVMRFEIERSRLQATADRAVLAAANLQQARDSEAVVRDYFEKTGMGDRLEEVESVQTINQRRVGASTRSRVDSLFMGMLGVPQLTVPTSATAEESATDIEISLVLDVLYSMQYDIGARRATGRIARLRSAASQFVQTVLANDTQHRVSINVIPFNGQVNLGPTLFNRFVTTYPGRIVDIHGFPNSNCLDLPSNAYAQVSLGTGFTIPQTGHFDAYATASTAASYQAPLGFATSSDGPNDGHTQNLAPVCRTTPANRVVVGGQASASLQSTVQNLEAGGGTSISLGMKYGLLFLDPGSRALLNGLVPTGRPFDFGRSNTTTIIVLMTDGEHQVSLPEQLQVPQHDNLSPAYYNAGTNTYAFDTNLSTNQYWAPQTGGFAGSFPGTQLSWAHLF